MEILQNLTIFVIYTLLNEGVRTSLIFMKEVPASKNVWNRWRIFFYYRDIFIFVFFHVLMCLLLLPCMHKSSVLPVGVKTLYNILGFSSEDLGYYDLTV